jgi:60 kDa SS-A/Ro ribonucleoprotein
MASINKKPDSIYTHEGAKAKHISFKAQLERSVMACLLWEKQFYESGENIADRIKSLIPNVLPQDCADIAIKARSQMNLRHVPLLIVREMARLEKHKALVAATLPKIIQRPDELTEFLAIYWADKRQPLSAQVKRGLAKAFTKFSEYQLAKYNRDNAVKLRDVLFLSHAKPQGEEQEALFKRLVNKELQTPDTWEVALSSGADKKETWERLLTENKLGGLALLRNLRNMTEVNVDAALITNALSMMKTERILPFRFIAAARHAVSLEPYIEVPMLKACSEREKLKGKTILLVDVSGSMDNSLSKKSDMTRLDAGCGLGILLREVCEQVRIITFSSKIVEVPTRRGFALRDAIFNSQMHASTFLGEAIRQVNNLDCYRVIVITDEQSQDRVPDPVCKNTYMINVASNKNGVGYGSYAHIDGFSESVVDYIVQSEVE